MYSIFQGDNSWYSVLFRVNYVEGITTSLDELYNLTCLHAGDAIDVFADITNVSTYVIETRNSVTFLVFTFLRNLSPAFLEFKVCFKNQGVHLTPGSRGSDP